MKSINRWQQGWVQQRLSRSSAAVDPAGFTLLELLLVLLLGSGLMLVCFNVIFRDGQLVSSMAKAARRTQERELVTNLIRNDLVQGSRVLSQEQLRQLSSKCHKKNRPPVLVIEMEGKQVVYALGPPSSKIWTGRVLWRCAIRAGKTRSAWTVIIDRLGETATTWPCPSSAGEMLMASADLPFSACIERATGLVMFRLSQGGQATTGSGVVGLARSSLAPE